MFLEVKVFSLYVDETEKIRNGLEVIEECISCFFHESSKAEHYTSQKRMILAVSQSLRAADVVVVAVSSDMYNTTKKLLCSQLGLVIETNSDCAGLLAHSLENGTLKQSTFINETGFPEDAVLLQTGDARNCGFAVTRESQTLIYVPVESPRAHQVVLGSLYDFLSTVTDEDYSGAFEKRSERLFSRTVDNLEKNCIKIVFRISDDNGYFIKYGNVSSGTDCIVLDNDDALSETDDCSGINISRSIKDRHFAHYGVYVKSVESDESGERFVYAAVADEEGTDTFKFYAEDEESDEDLYESAMNRLMIMLYDYNYFADITFSSLNDSGEDKKIRNFTFTAVGSGLILSFVLSVIVAIILK